MTDASPVTLTPDMLLAAYANGYFPMAMSADDPELYWFAPEQRGVLPLDTFHIPHGLKKTLAKNPYHITVDTAFEEVIRACGAKTPERQETWINENIVRLYTGLHQMGHAHSVEVWEEVVSSELSVLSTLTTDNSQLTTKLVGGLYGVSIGGAFFGESMFSRASNASKIALVALVNILREAGYQLLDTQYVNDHLKQFGVEEISKKRYMTKLEKALMASPNPSMRFSTASVRSGAASSSSANFTSAS